jgi:hypothetical protein
VKSARRGWGGVEPEPRSQAEQATLQSTRRCWWVLGKLVRQREQEGVKSLGKRGLGAPKESCWPEGKDPSEKRWAVSPSSAKRHLTLRMKLHHAFHLGRPSWYCDSYAFGTITPYAASVHALVVLKNETSKSSSFDPGT